jgi:hypothetical protein
VVLLCKEHQINFTVMLMENKTQGLFFLIQVPWSNQAVSLLVLVEKQCFVINEYFPAVVLHIYGLAVKI